MRPESFIAASLVWLLLPLQGFGQDTQTLSSDRAKTHIKDAAVLIAKNHDPVVEQPAPPEQNGPIKRAARHGSHFALTLAGGGARGAAEIGVLKVLDEEGLRPDFIAGNSIGAIIGALYASGLSAIDIERLALNGEFKHAFFPVNRKLKTVLYGSRYMLARAFLLKPGIGVYSGKSLERLMLRNLPKDVRNVEDTKIPLAVTAVNVIDTKPVWLTRGNLAEAVRASSSVPFFFRPMRKDGMELIDGGMRENLPTEVAKAAGAPLVVAVKLHSYLEKVPRKEFDTTFDYADRLTSIMMAEIEGKAASSADVLIEPEVQYMTLHSFDPKNMAEAIASGEKAARQALPQLKKLLQERDMQSASAKPFATPN